MGSENLRFNKFDLYFESDLGNIIFERKDIISESGRCHVTLNADEWKSVYSHSVNFYKLYYMAWQTTGNISGGYYSETLIIHKPASYSPSKIQVKPNEWGFEGRYYFADEVERDSSKRYSTFEKGNLTIFTDRLRCGFIENSYINLSPRRQNAGVAYLEMTFNKPVFSFLYSVCLWSQFEDLDGTAILQTKGSNGVWKVLSDLKSDITLTYRSGGPERYSHYDASGMYGIRFEVTATAVGTRNKGRLCIDDLVFSTSQDVSDSYYYVTNYARTSC